MLVGPDAYREVWEAVIIDTHNSEQKSISIFVSTQDCDSVCTVRALQVWGHTYEGVSTASG